MKNLFEKFDDFTLDDVYRALDTISKYDEELQIWIYDHSVTKYSRDISATYFDYTNYYYDISSSDEDGKLVFKNIDEILVEFGNHDILKKYITKEEIRKFLKYQNFFKIIKIRARPLHKQKPKCAMIAAVSASSFKT